MAAAVVKDVPFLVVYPRVALGHAASGMPPPGSAADAATLLETCNMNALARFIQGGDDDPAPVAALREAGTVLQRYRTALHARISLAAGTREEAASVRAAIAAAAPAASAVWAGAGGGPAVAGAFDAQAWLETKMQPQLQSEVHAMAYGMASECSAIELGRQLALLCGATGPEVGVKPATEFTGAAAAALARVLPALLSHEAYDGHELYECICARIVDWAGCAAPTVPVVLVFGWLIQSGALPPDNSLVPPEAQPWHTLLKAAVNGTYLTAQRNADAAVLDADTAARVRTRLAAGREAMFAAARSLVIRIFGRLDADLFWAGPDRAARDAARDATCKVLETALKGKQATMATGSVHKSAKDTKLGKLERATPVIAEHAAAAFEDAAVTALLKAARLLFDGMSALVVQHTGHLRNGGTVQLPQRQLWPALKALAAVNDLAARMELRCAPAAGGAAPAAQQLLPFSILARLVPKLASFLHADTTLGDALGAPHFQVIALALAAEEEAARLAHEEPAGSSAVVSAASAAQQWRAWADGNASGRARMTAMVSATLRALLPVFGAAARIGAPSDALIRFLSDPANAGGGGGADADASSTVRDWSVPERFFLLSACKAAAAELATAAWQPVGDSLAQCSGACRPWVTRVSELYKAEADSRRSAADEATAAAEHTAAREAGRARTLLPVAQRLAPSDWVGVHVSRVFQDEHGILRPYSGWVTHVSQGGASPLFMVLYEDNDSQDMTLQEVQHFAVARANPISPSASAGKVDPSVGEWRERTLPEVFALLSALQASAGSGPEALRELRERYAPSPLKPEDGWLVDAGQFTPAGVRLTRFYYYGGLDAEGKPSGMAPGSESVAELHAKDAQPTREFTAWTQVHAFRGTGATLAMPRIGGGGGGGGRGNRMSGAEEAEVKRWMTPRKVVRDGVARPDDELAVSEAQSEHVLGCWQWLYKTRKSGKSAGKPDVLYCPPGGEPGMRSLVNVKNWFAASTGGTVRAAACMMCQLAAGLGTHHSDVTRAPSVATGWW
jgi:hypothetical protein